VQGHRGKPGYDDPRLILVKAEWDREWDRKESFEKRGITVITASGVFVTLVFGFGASVTKSHHFANFTFAEKILLAVSLGWFILSGFVALMTNIPARIGTVPPRVVLDAPPERMLRMLVDSLESLRQVNKEKANQLVAIATLGGTVIAVVA